MAIAVAQEPAAVEDGGVAGLTQALAFVSNVTAGNAIVVFSFSTSSAVTVTGVTDSLGNTYGAAKTSAAIGGRTIYAHVATGILGGANTVTATWNTSTTGKSIWAMEISQCSAYQVANSQTQTNPGVTADAISSNTMTPSSQPCLLVGLVNRFGGPAVTASAGTGFTAGPSGWAYGATARARSETKRLTATTAVAATFTNATDGGAASYYALGVVLTEAAAATTSRDCMFFAP